MEIVLFGFLFGAILMYAKLNRFNTISGLVFAIFTFIGLLITGKLFYTKKIIHDSTRIYTATS